MAATATKQGLLTGDDGYEAMHQMDTLVESLAAELEKAASLVYEASVGMKLASIGREYKRGQKAEAIAPPSQNVRTVGRSIADLAGLTKSRPYFGINKRDEYMAAAHAHLRSMLEEAASLNITVDSLPNFLVKSELNAINSLRQASEILRQYRTQIETITAANGDAEG